MKYSIVSYGTVLNSSHSMRLDAEFFRPDYLETEQRMWAISGKRLRDFGVQIKHPKEITRTYVENGVKFLRAQNVRPMEVDLNSNTVFITDNDAETLRDNLVEPKDILLTRTGANFGQCAIYLEEEQIVASSHTFIIRSGDINPFLLTVFFNTRYGRKLIDKGQYGGSQPEVAPYFLYQVPIPKWDSIQEKIEDTYVESYKLAQLSKNVYASAENLLLADLGFTEWRPKHNLTFVKNYSELKLAQRFDSDYFQPQYDEVVDAIKNYPGGWRLLGQVVNLKDRTFIPQDLTEYRYIELANIASNGEISGCMIAEGQELPSRARRRVSSGDVIVSSIEGSLSSIALIGSGYNQALCSTGFHVVNSSIINSETLLVLLKSVVGQQQLKKGSNGTILASISKNEFRQIVVPFLSEVTQDQIRELVGESFRLRRQSRLLLERAKRAIEVAIEADEGTAINWLEEQAESDNADTGSVTGD